MFTFQVKLQVSLKDCNYCKSTILDINVRLITKLSEKMFWLGKENYKTAKLNQSCVQNTLKKLS